MHFSFKGKIALVTGAGRGIGRDIAKALAEEEAIVYAFSKNPDNLKSLQEEYPNNVRIIACDLGNWKETEKALAVVEPVDYLVNNAGVAQKQMLEEVTEELCDWHYDINVKAVINVTKIITNKMISVQKKGVIVNVSSTAEFKPGRGLMVYHSSKAALGMLSKSMAKQLAPHGIRVISMNPTLIPTDMGALWSKEEAENIRKSLPLQQLPSVRHCTNATLFLLSDLSEMTTGAYLPVDAGGLLA